MTEAGRQRVPRGDTMALSDHRSVATAMRYFQAGAGTATALVKDLAVDESGRDS